MSDAEPFTLPSSEGLSSQQDQADLQPVCSGRRRTCALLNSPSPCVNSAICHIQKMRSLTENWFQKHRKYQPEIYPSKPIYSKPLRAQLRDSHSDSSELYVEGIAISAKERDQRCPLQKKINDVLSEVVHLVERLEADRQYAEEALQKEKRIGKTLESQVDSISQWKLIEHPLVVQKEHEACSRDITELKWQLELEKQKVERVQEKLLQAEVLNRKIEEEIQFVQNQILIVNENLDCQKDILHQIDTAKAKADEVYSETSSHLSQAQMELREMKTEAKKEMTLLDHRKMEMESQLAEKMENLKQLKMVEKNLLAEMKETEENITVTENQCKQVVQQIPKIVEFEKLEEEKILQLSLKIENEIQKNQKLKEKLTSKQDEINRKKPMWEAEVSITEEQLQSKHKAFTDLCKEKQEYEQKVEDYKMRICNREKAVKQMHEERKQMLQKITENEEQWEKAKKEVTQVVAQHSVIKAKLEEQEQFTFMEEQKAREMINNMNKDLTTNLATLEELNALRTNVNNELKKQRGSSELTNQQLQKEFDESSSATQTLETKIKGMKELAENFEKLQCEHKKTLVNLQKENELKRDQLKAAQDLLSVTLQKIDNTLARTTLLGNENEEYQEASKEIKSIVKTLPEVIAELEKDFEMMKFKNKSASLFMSTLQADINNRKQETQQFMTTRSTHLKARKELMEDTKETLNAALEENKQLASSYEDLKKRLLAAKQGSVSALGVKNTAHETLSYYKKLSLLQKRMHKVLVKYLEQRSLDSQAELDRCQALSQQTTQKIKTAQEKLSERISLLSALLESI